MSLLYDAFISYGRADSKAFATKLNNDLTAAGFKIWFDQNDIPLGVDFQNQIDDGIEKADNFLFIIAPHSVNSAYCLKEINLAVKYKKRIIPLLHVEQITYETWQQRNPQKTKADWQEYQQKGLHSSFPNMHPEIGRINWVYFREKIDDYDKSLTGLIELFHRDEDYVRQHTQILVKALSWEQNQQQTRYLLVGKERQAAEKWLKIEFKDEQPPCIPTDLQCELICESIKNANNLMTQVFLSYAELNREAMLEIRKRLIRYGITVWTNKTDIEIGSDFQKQIDRGIEGADNLVYLLSPESIASEYCQQEISLALSLNKRIISLLIEPTDLEVVPAKIRELQYIDFTGCESEEEYGVCLDKLIKELGENAVYYQQHKALLVKAIKWHEQNCNPSILLRGYNLERYQTWLGIAQVKQLHPPTDLQIEFIAESSKQPSDSTLDVFISYSRADGDFARGLNEALQTQGKTTWFDQESIATGTDFQTEIYRGIEQSDNFVFVISPDSVNSPYCADEVEYAKSLNKRLVTVLRRKVNSAELHPELAKVQWLDFNRYGGDFYENFSELVRTLDTDREYVREHTKKSQTAREWKRRNRSLDLLLRGSECVAAYEWLKLVEKENKHPPVTEDVKEFILKSKAEAERLQKAEHRRKNIIAGASLGAIALLSALSIYAFWQGNQARRQSQIARAGRLAADSESMRARYRGLHLGSVLLAIESMNEFQDVEEPSVTADRALRGGLSLLRDSILDISHDAPVTGVAFSGNGKYIATGSEDRTARVWDAVTGKEITRLAQARPINAIAFSADGKKIATVSDDNTARVWDVATGEEIIALGHEGRINAIAFSRDGEKIATASDDNTARVWDAATGEEIIAFGHDSQVWAVDFSTDGEKIATGSYDKVARVWDIASAREVARMEHDGWVRAVAFSKDDKYAASSSDDHTAKVWDAATGEEVARLHHDGPVNALAFGADDKYIATASDDHTAGVWDITTGEEVARLNHSGSVNAVALSDDGKYIVTGSDDETVGVWSAITTREILRLGHSRAVNAIAFSGDGNFIASGSDDNTARVWDAVTGNEVVRFEHDAWVWAVAFSNDGKYVATGSWDNTARVWDATTEEEIRRFQHDGTVWAITFSDDGKYVATGSWDNTARVWDTATGEEVVRLRHDDEVWAVAFSRDGKYIATGSDDDTARIWDAATGLELARLRHDGSVKAVAFSQDGQYVATGGEDNTARVWDAETGSEVARVWHDSLVRTVAFNSDGNYIVTGSTDRTARVWDWAAEEERVWIDGNTAVRSVAFNADDEYIIVASDNQAVRKHLLDFKDLKKQVCRRLRRNLTANEWQRHINQELHQYRKTCEAQPVHPSLIAEAGQLVHSDRLQEAEKLLGAILKLDDGIDLIPKTEEIERDPKAAIKWFQADSKVERGMQQAIRGEIQEAIAAFEVAQELYPGIDLNPYTTKDIAETDPGTTARWFAGAYQIYQGLLSLKQGRVDEAIAAFSEAQKLQPNIDLNPNTDEIEKDPEEVVQEFASSQIVQQAMQAAEEGRVEEAIAIFQEAQTLQADIDLNPNTEVRDNDRTAVAQRLAAKSKVSEGVRLALQGNIEGAIAAFQQAQEWQPDIDLNPDTEVRDTDPETVAQQLAAKKGEK